MPEPSRSAPSEGGHGRLDLPAVSVESYNLELRDEQGFIGDKATEGTFRDRVDALRQRLRDVGSDPFGETPTGALGKEEFDDALMRSDTDAAGLVHGAVEDFAQDLAEVLRHFLRQPPWRGVQRIVCGGGLQKSRIGPLVIGRAGVILKSERFAVDLCALHHEPDEGGLVGWVHVAPAEILDGFEAILAVDIGGTNIRCGIVELNREAAPDRAGARVRKRDKWRHGDEETDRDAAVEHLAGMLEALAGDAEADGLRLAPFVGLACPGLIAADGAIRRGAQNLPGDWEDEAFNLPETLRGRIPEIAGRPTRILIHNDAVVQGLSQLPLMRDVGRWAAVTIGTGLGNASYANRR